MPAPTDYKLRFGTFVGWVILLTALGIGSYFGYQGYTQYNLGYAKGQVRGKAFYTMAHQQNLHAAMWNIAMGDWIKRDTQKMKNGTWLEKLYSQGWDEGFHNITDNSPH